MSELDVALTRQLELQEELHALLKRETQELTEVHVDAMAEINALKNDISLIMNSSLAIASERGWPTKSKVLAPRVTILGLPN